MAAKQGFGKLVSLVCAAAVGGGVSTYVVMRKKTAYASWTTNFEPSTQWDWNWDRREPTSIIKPEKGRNGRNPTITTDLNNNINNNNNSVVDNGEEKPLKSVATRHLIFIRHGQYNMEGVDDTSRMLTTLGTEQAALTGERLADLGLPYTHLIYSTMTRATETAQIINSKIGVADVESCALLREGAPIPPEPPLGSWRAEMHKFHTDGARIEAAFRKHVHRAPPSQTQDSHEIFVCHANVIRYFVCRALQVPPEAWLRFSLRNGSMTLISVRPDGRVGIKSIGDAGFMPPNKLTFN